ncbi:MAG: D-alanyl-D-alanine carboxypeptidase/D-alanyl-D-alanine-endopeptidase [Chitinophagaceae bacterium]|nr:MAG: D-alanyl-D-alanine carboxypeptidase/D-alanyl-D-alanine-endopeptidase [Chitinophagaceae bacterium]
MFFNVSWLLFSHLSFGQPISTQLQKAFQQFENDPQLKHALVSLYIVDAKTGNPVFDKNSQTGLAPASTQKIITSATAFEVLGKDYRYKTNFGVIKKAAQNILYIQPSGDPTFGSWRWEQTKEQSLLSGIADAARNTKNGKFDAILIDTTGWNEESTPDGWIWQDIGNYYGAGASALNWRENQYDLFLRSGNSTGSSVSVVKTEPRLYNDTIISMATAGAKGSGDNAYIYLPAGRSQTIVRGTIPPGENSFGISGSLHNPAAQFAATLADSLKKMFVIPYKLLYNRAAFSTVPAFFYTQLSPSLDSIIYWFNKKSINLYGEALIRTMAYLKKGQASTEEGVGIVRSFWKERGLEEEELNMVDGSGLSPLNRVTTHAQVTILRYAKSQSWYAGFYNALPEYNGMKMKSGTISGAKGFCGYQRSKDGNEYVFSFLVNNYSGPASALVNKMYRVLDVLK